MAISNRRDRCSSFSCHWENVPLGWHNTPPLIHQSNNIYSNVSRRAKTGSSDVMLPSRRRDSSVSFGHTSPEIFTPPDRLLPRLKLDRYASPFRHSDSTSQTDSSNHQSFQHNFNSISNMASMKGYLKPRCSRSSLSNTISLQDCYGALSQLPFNASDSLSLSRPVSQSANTCSLTVSKVTEKNADPSDQASIVNVYAPTLFGPVGQILTSCSNQVE
ncbi:hypothetical protein PGT21_032758 [Puccinia graminis f. sp. tritici]|uniref:Uncharacterized protein n=1 Tax=Puccinia graminis f. sp. tritici TaxID=56615 RepID=A0A5B0PMN9_PUCGR|nr:hypothetical protein PGT21_032758 [Puccinia graminis f. sp. tritici]